jgi:hypothetical protein
LRARTLVAACLSVFLAGCGVSLPFMEAPTPGAEPSAPATPSAPSSSPEPTPEPSVDVAAIRQAYVDITERLAVTACEVDAMIAAAPVDIATWRQGIAILGPAFAEAVAGIRSIAAPGELGSLLEEVAAALEAYASSIATLQSAEDIYALFLLFDEVVTARHRVAEAGDDARTALGLPPRPLDPCFASVSYASGHGDRDRGGAQRGR